MSRNMLWLTVAAFSMYTCLAMPFLRDKEQNNDQLAGVLVSRRKRDVHATSRATSFTPRSRHSLRRWTTRPVGHTWVPPTGTINSNLTEKEIYNRENKTRKNFNGYPTANRFYTTSPFRPAVRNTVEHSNSDIQLASNLDAKSTRPKIPPTAKHRIRMTPSSKDKQSSELSFEDNYAIAIAVLFAILCLASFGFVTVYNRIRKRKKVFHIPTA